MPQTTEMEQFLSSIGPFYTEIDTDDSNDKQPDPSTPITMETPPLKPVAETNDDEESPSERVLPKPTNQIADEEGESDGESGAESDSSIDFKDSFQELSVSGKDHHSNNCISNSHFVIGKGSPF